MMEEEEGEEQEEEDERIDMEHKSGEWGNLDGSSGIKSEHGSSRLWSSTDAAKTSPGVGSSAVYDLWVSEARASPK